MRHPVVRLDFGGGDFGDPDGVREETESQLKAAERRAGAGRRQSFGPLPGTDRGPARTHRAAGGGSGGRVRQADSGRARRPGAGAGQPGLPAQPVRGGLRQASPFRFPDGSEQILEGGPVLGLNNLRHAGAGILGYLRLHGRGTGRGLRPGTRWPGPGRGPSLVQRLQLARAGEGLQSVRPPAAVSAARVPPVLVRERHADLPGGDAGAPRPAHSSPGRHGESLLSAFDVDRMSVQALLFQTGYLSAPWKGAFVGANPTQQLSFRLVAARAVYGG